LIFESLPSAQFKFSGSVGERVEVNIENWLLRAPQSNPGMLEMFRVRDRKPVPQLVPWAGEFAGKYLISAVQALRMSDDPRLRQQVSKVVPAHVVLDRFSFPTDSTNRLPCYWRVVSITTDGETIADVPPAWFRIDPTAPPQVLPAEPKLGPTGEMIVHSLRGTDAPQFGEPKPAIFSSRDENGTEVNGRDQMLAYAVPAWPEEDFTVSVRVNIKELPQKRIGQIFSAWAGGMDDPLRLVVDGGKLFARIEVGGGFSTPGAPVETGRWHSVAATKRGGTLTLLVDGRAVGSCAVPEFITTQAQDCALGGNPHFSGNEFLSARFSDFHFYAKSLSTEEIQALSRAR
jgi:hypothetical protein